MRGGDRARGNFRARAACDLEKESNDGAFGRWVADLKLKKKKVAIPGRIWQHKHVRLEEFRRVLHATNPDAT
jgi:hypothetical protein